MKPSKLLNRFNRRSTPDAAQDADRQIGLISQLIGCSHRTLSRPFIEGSTAYKCCLKCGARRHFNQDTFETYGKFYYPPIKG